MQHLIPSGSVFIVDDDAAIRDALSVVFTLAGYRVTAFSDAISFLAAARRHGGVVAVSENAHDLGKNS